MLATFSNFCEIFCSTEWFQQQQEFTNETENKEVDELNIKTSGKNLRFREENRRQLLRKPACCRSQLPSTDILSPESFKNMSLLYFIFSNDHQCNYTKTISRLKRREYRRIVASTSSRRLIFADIHVILGD